MSDNPPPVWWQRWQMPAPPLSSADDGSADETARSGAAEVDDRDAPGRRWSRPGDRERFPWLR